MQDYHFMTKQRLIIATRESPLALEQAHIVSALLKQHHPELLIELLGITTEADKRLEVTLTDIGGKGLFVKELEEALLDGRADIAVHSVKDVPMELPKGLILPVMLKREDARDAFISNRFNSLEDLPNGAVLGTSSLRRQTQMQALRPDLEIKNLRGNIQTRLKRLDEGQFDAIILASAGLKRMGLEHRINSYLPIEACLPAAGQGALGIECREGDEKIFPLIYPLIDQITFDCVSAERALCTQIGGGCKVPVAAYAEMLDDKLYLQGLVSGRNGSNIIRVKQKGKRDQAQRIGKIAGEELQALGAHALLSEFYD